MSKISSTTKTKRKKKKFLIDACTFLHGNVKCYACGGVILDARKATFEHKIPKGKGGKSNMGNLALSHRDCNRERGDSVGMTYGFIYWLSDDYFNYAKKDDETEKEMKMLLKSW